MMNDSKREYVKNTLDVRGGDGVGPYVIAHVGYINDIRLVIS